MLKSTTAELQKSQASFSGADIDAYFFIPVLADPRLTNRPSFKKFGELQTISISSTRSISPVRALGRSSPIGYTRGGRTFAGTMVFATFDKDVFSDLYRPDVAESYIDSATSLFVDQMPPFTIVLTAANELGAVAQQIISGITLVNYGVTYSVDDVYTETTYTYVATDVTPLLPTTINRGSGGSVTYKTPFEVLSNYYSHSYGTSMDIYESNARDTKEVISGLVSAAETAAGKSFGAITQQASNIFNSYNDNLRAGNQLTTLRYHK